MRFGEMLGWGVLMRNKEGDGIQERGMMQLKARIEEISRGVTSTFCGALEVQTRPGLAGWLAAQGRSDWVRPSTLVDHTRRCALRIGLQPQLSGCRSRGAIQWSEQQT